MKRSSDMISENEDEVVTASEPTNKGVTTNEGIKDCSYCWGEIDDVVSYRKNTSNEWFTTSVCLECIMRYRNTQYGDYIKDVQTTDCKRTLRRLLEVGPPIWIHDKTVFKNVDSEEYVIELKCNDEIMSAKLDGCLEGEERLALWERLKTMREED